jgi:hypothetical protein
MSQMQPSAMTPEEEQAVYLAVLLALVRLDRLPPHVVHGLTVLLEPHVAESDINRLMRRPERHDPQ